jgi:hypothetical protein
VSKKGRSPSYPALSLEEAINRTSTFYDRERFSMIPVSAAIETLGHKSTSGGGRATLSALVKFGLLQEQGRGDTRRVGLSELGKRIILNDDPMSLDRQEAIKDAALAPTIHRKIWDKYKGNIPSDTTLKFELRKQGFLESGLASLLKEFRDTIRFARLSSEDDGGRTEAEDKQAPHESATVVEYDRLTSPRKLVLPVAMDKSINIEGRFPLSESEWDQFMRVLEAMKPALVSQE